MKKSIAVLTAALLSVAMISGCGSEEESSSSSAASAEGSSSAASTAEELGPVMEDIKSTGTLVMLTNATFPPFEYTSGTEVAGVDVDIAGEIAKDLSEVLGVEVTLQVSDGDFDSIVPSLESGKGHVALAGMTVTEERQQQVDFSEPYISSSQYIIQPEGSNLQTMADLAGKRIGAQLGTTGDILISDEIASGSLAGTGATISQYKSALEAGMDLANGRLDAVVIDQYPAAAIASQMEGLKVSDASISDSESYAVAVAKGNEDLLEVINATIDRLNEEGKISEFMTNHSTTAAEEAPAGESDTAEEVPAGESAVEEAAA